MVKAILESQQFCKWAFAKGSDGFPMVVVGQAIITLLVLIMDIKHSVNTKIIIDYIYILNEPI